MRLVRSRAVLVTASLALTTLATASPAAAGGRTIRVDDDGRATAASCQGSAAAPSRIGRAIRAARSGDTILVCPGTYPGRLSVPDTKKRLTIASVQPRKAVLVAGPRGGSTFIELDGPRTTFRGFTIRRDTDQPCDEFYQTALDVSGRGSVLSGNRIVNVGGDTTGLCAFFYGIGVHNDWDAPAGYDRISVYDNVVVDPRNGGISLDQEARARVTDNLIRYLHESAANPLPAGGTFDDTIYGIQVYLGSNAIITANTIESGELAGPLPSGTAATPRLQAGISLRGDQASVPQESITVSLNTIRRTDVGILVRGDGDPMAVEGNTITSGDYGIVVAGGTGVTVHDNQVTGTGTGIYLDGATLGSSVTSNEATDNILDCHDDSTGGGTAGTANSWVDNVGLTDDPDGICQPPT